MTVKTALPKTLGDGIGEELVQKVARAICDALGHDPDGIVALPLVPAPPGARPRPRLFKRPRWEAYLGAAEAAIKSMD